MIRDMSVYPENLRFWLNIIVSERKTPVCEKDTVFEQRIKRLTEHSPLVALAGELSSNDNDK